MLQLSDTEIDALPAKTPVYDGVGRMYSRPNNHIESVWYHDRLTDVSQVRVD